MRIHRLSTKKLPKSLKGITRKHTFAVNILDDGASVSTFGTWWDGGSKAVFFGISITTGQTRPLTYSTAPPQFGGLVHQLRPPRGDAILQRGWFRGKQVSPTIHLLPEDAAILVGIPALPAGINQAPCGIQADWLEDNHRPADAEKMRRFFLA
jgi:hypothetical protein